MIEIIEMLSLSAILVIAGIYMGIRMTLQAFENMDEDRLRRIICELRDGNDPLKNMQKRTKVMPLTFSAANDLILAYNALTGEFVSQGRDNEEMLEQAIERFPDRFFVLGSEELRKEQS